MKANTVVHGLATGAVGLNAFASITNVCFLHLYKMHAQARSTCYRLGLVSLVYTFISILLLLSCGATFNFHFNYVFIHHLTP